MSSRKRPLTEIAQPHTTPGRYAPSTPHALRALQQRGSAKQRSARSTRRVNNIADAILPDGSARNILRQLAKITAPVTRKRVSTPIHTHDDKENTALNENEDDSIILKRPNFAIEECIDEEDSELPVAPTPSVLPEDDDDDEQPTITFRNLAQMQQGGPASERVNRRKSQLTTFGGESAHPGSDLDDEQDGEATIMIEKGRRAFSEEATGRLSRYSFGSIRMSDFGTELEIRRESDRQTKLAGAEDESYMAPQNDYTIDLGGEIENLEQQPSPTGVIPEGDSVQFGGLDEDTFNLQMPEDETEEEATQHVLADAQVRDQQLFRPEDKSSEVPRPIDDPILSATSPTKSRRQTLLENATTQTQTVRRKRVKLTRHGTVVPALPSNLVKRIAIETQTKQGKRKPKLGHDHMKALEQATEWYFEQLGEDLAAYASHGKRRKRVDTDDVLLLMKRQKVSSNHGDLRKLAKEWLPKDILADLELPDRP